jgi:hypothetical protein
MLDAFHYRHPDKIPVVYHPSPAGLYTHGQKLLDLFNQYPPDNPIVFDHMPAPPVGTVETQGQYREIRTDEWGTTWKHNIFGVHGHPIAYPFPNWQAAKDYSFPPFHAIGTPEFEAEKVAIQKQKETHLVFRGWISIFEKLHALRPIDDLLVDLALRDSNLLAFLDRLVDYWQQHIARELALGTDVIVFGDDWGTQTAQIISTPMFRDIFKPRYQTLMAPIHRAGKKIFFHSCGQLGDIFNELIDLGIDGFWPQITRYNPNTFPEMCKQHGITIYIHPDRQHLIPLGTPTEIETAIQQYAERYHALGGGGIFYIEMENDAPFENICALIKAVHQYR